MKYLNMTINGEMNLTYDLYLQKMNTEQMTLTVPYSVGVICQFN